MSMTDSVFHRKKIGLFYQETVMSPGAASSTAASFSLNSGSKEFLNPPPGSTFKMTSLFVAAYSPKRHSVGLFKPRKKNNVVAQSVSFAKTVDLTSPGSKYRTPKKVSVRYSNKVNNFVTSPRVETVEEISPGE
jgi:hypothetical protein